MNFVHGILSDRIIDALGWTILHSLWQGLIIGILLFLLLYLFRYHNAAIRYNLSVFSLIIIFGLSILTFIHYFRADCPQDFSNNHYGILQSGVLTSNSGEEIYSYKANSGVINTTLTGTFRSVTDAISLRFPFIITLWLTGVFIISVRMTGGIFITHRLKNSCQYPIPEKLLHRFRALTSLMNIRKEVKLYESSIVRVPSVIGYFKPVILLPISAVSQIPVDQLEAILAHELAHIRRHDWLANLFQSLLEALFFYHPVVWIIQQRIRKERENCCDDMALSYSGGQIIYIKALTSIHKIPAHTGFPILALGSKKYHLLNRVLRILKNGKMKTNLKDKLAAGFILASAIVIILLNTGGKFISFNSQPGNLTDTLSSNEVSQPTVLVNPLPVINIVENIPETAPVIDLQTMIEPLSTINPIPIINPEAIVAPVLNIELLPVVRPVPLIESLPDTSLKVKDNIVQRTIYKKGKEVNLKMKIEKGKVTELYVDGEKIPEKDYSKYQDEIDETLDDLMKLEEDLSEANQKLNQIEMENLKREIEENMKEIQERMQDINIDAMVDNIKNIDVPEIDKEKIKREIEHAIQEIQTIDMEKIRAEMEFAMQSACEAMKNIELPDMDELKLEMEKAMQELEEVDQAKIQHEIQEALRDIQIDKEEIRKEMEKAFQELKEIDMDDIKRDIESEKMKMEEMLRELEKLEIEKK